jgi:predicted GH43/DUF377 family glycosyl hydrolase
METFSSSILPTDRDYWDREEVRNQFTDRESLIHIFKEKLVQSPPVPVLMFFGVGGAGKTYLLRYLQQEYGCRWQDPPQGYPHAFVSFRPGHTPINPQEALWQARGQLVRCFKKLTFPRFDLLWGKIWERSNNMRIGENPSLLPDEVDWLTELLQSIELVPFIGDFTRLAKLGEQLSRRVLRELAVRRVQDWFQEKIEKPTGLGWRAALQVMDLGKLVTLLPVAFAADVNDGAAGLREPYNRVLLFVDNYEALQAQLGEAYGQELRSPIQIVAEELINLHANVLVTIAGRDRLRWAEVRRKDGKWILNPMSGWAQEFSRSARDECASRFLEQYLVGGLSEADSMEYLLQRRDLGDPELARQIYELTDGYALALGVTADILRDAGAPRTAELSALAARLLASGFEPLSEEWCEEISDWLLERLLEQLRLNSRYSLIGVVRAAAIPRWFSRDLLFHLVDGSSFPDQFRHLTGYSFVEPHQVGEVQVYQIHPVMRRLLRETIDHESLRLQWEETAEKWFEAKAEHTRGHMKWRYQLEALYHRWFCDPSAAALDLESWFDKLYRSQAGKCWELLNTTYEFVDHLRLDVRAQIKIYEATLHRLTYSERGEAGIHRELSLQAAEMAAALADLAGNEALKARAFLAIGNALSMRRMSEWLEVMRRAIAAAEKAGDEITLAESLLRRARIETTKNPYFGDFRAIDQAIHVFQQAEHTHRLMYALWTKAWVAMRSGKWKLTEEALTETERLNARLQDPFWTAEMLQVRGEYYAQRGQWQEVAEALMKARHLYQELNYTIGVCAATGWIGIAQCHLGEVEEGIQLVRTAFQIERDILDSREGAAKWLHYLGEFFIEHNRTERALQVLWLSESLREELEHTELLKTRRRLQELREADKASYEQLEAEFDPRKSEFAQYAFLWGLGPFRKHADNPILEPQGDDWESNAVLNPTAWTDGECVYLIYRAEGPKDSTDGHLVSRIGLATSTDGIHFKREQHPVMEPTMGYETDGGCEDPRVVRINDIFYMTYTAYDRKIARLAMATSRDLRTWEKTGLLFPEERLERAFTHKQHCLFGGGWSKAGAIIPEQINGYYWIYFGDTYIWLAYSKDLKNWEVREEPVLSPRPGYFDSQLVEPGPPPVLLPEGIWLGYNSADTGLRYAFGQALFSLDDPSKLLRRCTRPLLRPTTKEERGGQVPNVVFAGGLVEFRGKLFLYYGMADTRIGVAIAEPT